MAYTYTKEQEKAINCLDDNLQIIACAGSGKTEVISRRIINLLKEKKATPDNIIAFTYTEKAAGELKNRIYEMVKNELDGLKGMAEMYIGTIHGWCFKMLQKHHYDYQKYEVLDEIRLKLFVDRNFRTIGMKDIYWIDNPKMPMKMFIDTDKYIQLMNIVREAKTKGKAVLPKHIIEARTKYERTLMDNGYLDFSMIMTKAREHLLEKGEFYKRVTKNIKYLTVDEYQDINPIQEDIIKIIFEAGANICVVGDDDQNIYHWRGSNISYILNFAKSYGASKKVKTATLIENFRSSRGIVDVAQKAILKNKVRLDKEMISQNNQEYERDNILFNDFLTEEQENLHIAKTIRNLRGKAFIDKKGDDARGLDYSDFCILLRKWSKAEKIIEIFDREGIPYITGGVNKLFETKEVKASLAIFEFLNGDVNKKELLKLWLDVSPNIAKSKIESAIEKLKEKQPIKDETYYFEFILQKIFWEFLDDAEIREETFSNAIEKHENTFGEIKLYNLGKFSQVINDFETINFKTGNTPYYLFTFLNFIRHAAIDYYPEGWINSTYKTPNAVQIITIHQAKGLEFPVVFIPGMNRNYFPAKKMGGVSEWKFLDENIIEGADRYRGNDENNEGERRLFYVAITRSKKYLFISRAPHHSNRLYQKPSDFLDEINESKYIISAKNETYKSLNSLDPTPKDSTNNIELSFSILKDFFQCSYRFELNSIYGFAPPLSPFMGFGQTIHNSLAEIHKRSYDGNDIEETDTEEIVKRHENLPYAPPKAKGDMEKSIRNLVSNYIKDNKKEFKNIEFVEKDIQLNLEDGIFVSGKIDLIKKTAFEGNLETTIIEFKSKLQSQENEITKDQLYLYGLGHKELTGTKADFINIYVLDPRDGSKGFYEKLEDEHLVLIQDKIKEVVNKIRRKDFKRITTWDICKNCDQRLLCSGYKKSKPAGKK
ncbi:MAG TPA: ATP-dependent DNA helicase [Cyclobacteriaceae bacterium]|nr:ATP-dependent DNA helicase [Cyclobacteriaceae bacterium]